MEWKCPICNSKAYERCGGSWEPAIKVFKVGEKEVRQQVMVRTGRYFECKGCTTHFSNPRRFNKVNVRKHNKNG